MAYGKKYTYRNYLRDKTNTVTLDIYQDGYSGSVSEMVMDGEAPFIYQSAGGEADLGHPMMGAEIILRIKSETDQQYIEFSQAQVKEYYLEVMYNDSSRIFKFWMDPGEYEEPYKGAPYIIEIRFVDGLGMLKDEPFLDSGGEPFTGWQDLMTIIAYCLSTLDLSLGRIYMMGMCLLEDSMGIARESNGLKLAEINRDIFYDWETGTPDSCYDVLTKILGAFTCRIYCRTYWYIYRTPEIAGNFEDHKLVYQYYNDATGAYIGLSGAGETLGALSYDETQLEGVAISSVNTWVQDSQMLSFDIPWKFLNATFNYGYRQLVTGGNFISGWDEWWNELNSPSVTREDGESEGEYIINMGSGSSSSKSSSDPQLVHDGFYVAAGDDVQLNLQWKISWTGTPGGSEWIAVQVLIYLDATAGSGSDRWYVNDNTWVSAYSTFSATPIFFVMYSSDSKERNDSWIDYSLWISNIPYAGVLKIGLVELYRSSTLSVTITDNRYKNITCFGGSGSNAKPVTYQEVDPTMPDDNLEIGEISTDIGDVVISGMAGEDLFFKGALRYSGSPTNSWIPYYYTGVTRAQYGAARTLQQHWADFYAAQHQQPRMRLRGTMYRNSWAAVAGVRAVMMNDEIFLPVSWSCNYFKGLIDVEMVHVSPPVEYGDEVSGTWSNGAPAMATFNWDSATREMDFYADSSGQICDCANISVAAYEWMAIHVSIEAATYVTPARLYLGSSYIDLDFTTYDAIWVPTTGGASLECYIESASVCSYTDVIVSIYRFRNF